MRHLSMESALSADNIPIAPLTNSSFQPMLEPNPPHFIMESRFSSLPSDYARNGRRTDSATAFTLVEIVIALGLFTFCILGLFGLLGVALNTSTDSYRESATASLARTVNASIHSTMTTNTTKLTGTPQYFDLTGKPVASGSTNIYYRATYKVSKTASIPTLLPLTDGSKFNLWSVEVAYPPPVYPRTNFLLFGKTDY